MVNMQQSLVNKKFSQVNVGKKCTTQDNDANYINHRELLSIQSLGRLIFDRCLNFKIKFIFRAI
jgi:hypothetical protein